MNALADAAIGAHTFFMAGAYQTYAAHAFAADASQEPIEGEVFFTMRSMTFRSGETLIDIPLSELQVEHDSAGDGRVIFRQEGEGAWTIATCDTEVLECRSVPQIAEIAARLESQLARRELSRRIKMVLIFFVGAGLVLWLGMVAVGAMVRSIVARVPPSFEKEYGSECLEELKKQKSIFLLENTNLVAELVTVAEPLLKVMPKTQEWQFYVVASGTPNAFALPGGYILVTTGLLKFAKRPEELLAVLAHELAHVTEKHGFRSQVASAGPLLVFQVFLRGRSGATTLLGGGSALLVAQSFSQEYEKEADDVGWDYMVKAKIDPRGMIDVFRKLQAYEMKYGGESFVPKAFESHPDVAKRIARLEAKWKRLPQKSGFLDLADQFMPNPGDGITNNGIRVIRW